MTLKCIWSLRPILAQTALAPLFPESQCNGPSTALSSSGLQKVQGAETIKVHRKFSLASKKKCYVALLCLLVIEEARLVHGSLVRTWTSAHACCTCTTRSSFLNSCVFDQDLIMRPPIKNQCVVGNRSSCGASFACNTEYQFSAKAKLCAKAWDKLKASFASHSAL